MSFFAQIGAFFSSIAIAISSFFGATPAPVDTPQTTAPTVTQNADVETQEQTTEKVSAPTAVQGSDGAAETRTEASATIQTEAPSADASDIDDPRDDMPNVKKIGDSEYEKGKKFVFYNDTDILRPMETADFATFQVLTRNLAKDKARVYYRQYQIEGADGKTFALLSTSNLAKTLRTEYVGWAKDVTSVYCMGQKLQGSDPSTFRFEKYFAVDSKHIYDPISCASVSDRGSSFRSLGEGHATDGAAVFGYVMKKYRSSDGGYYYCFVNDQYVVGGDYSIGCDYHSGIGGSYTEPKLVKLEGAEVSTFKVLNSFYAKDAKTVYYNGKKIAGADAATFVITKEPYLAKDKNSEYEEGEEVW